MIIFLCVMAVLCFIMMIGSKRQEDRNNQTIAFAFVIVAIILLNVI